MAENTNSKQAEKPGFIQRLLDGVEKLGNKVPHPVLMFLYLIIIVVVVAHVMFLLGVSVTEEIAVPIPQETEDGYYLDLSEPLVDSPTEPYETEYEIEEVTIPIQSLLTTEGIRFFFTSFIGNFASFTVVSVILLTMVGVGVADASGLMGALIRKTVEVTPNWLITFIIILVGVLMSVATDAGYLILIPLGAIAFLRIGRHPLAGIAAAFAGVSALFIANIIVGPMDAMLTEITNEAIGLTSGAPITIVANLYFSSASTLILSLLAAVITTKMIEPRLGKYDPPEDLEVEEELSEQEVAAEKRGLRYAIFATLAFVVVLLLLTLPANAPLRDPETGAIIGNTPFMDSLVFIITLIFLFAGIGYGFGAKTFKGSNDVIKGVTTAFANLSGLIFILLMIAQFIAFFNYTNLPQVIAVWMAEGLEQAAIGSLPLMLGFIVVIMTLNIIIPNVIPKWAIFAPIFIPVFFRLGVAPQTVLAAYRVGDSPSNVITPLMAYLPFVLVLVQRYQKDAGIGTLVALMLPYTVLLSLAWMILFAVWFALGIPMGPGYPVGLP